MGYNIEIKGSGSASELVDALQRVIDELETEPELEVSYSTSNGNMEIILDVEITPYADEEEGEEED
jgi:hypothetical protein